MCFRAGGGQPRSGPRRIQGAVLPSPGSPPLRSPQCLLPGCALFTRLHLPRGPLNSTLSCCGHEGQEAGDFLVSAEDSRHVPHLSLRPGHGSFSGQTTPLRSRFPLSPPARARTPTSSSSLPWRMPRLVHVTGLRVPEGPGELGIPFTPVAGASEPKFGAQPLPGPASDRDRTGPTSAKHSQRAGPPTHD